MSDAHIGTGTPRVGSAHTPAPSTGSPATTRNTAGRLLGGRYTLLTPVAQGGMGEVWKARDRETGRLVAAKVLRPELSGEEASLSRLRIEARNSMRIQHPNIASVLDSGEDDGRGWIVMELVEGHPLTDHLRGNGRLSVEDLLPVLVQVAMALHAAAAAGVVHRDIKPANILVRDDGVVKLTDFGISRTVDQATLTAAGMVMGTAQYLPPEQAMGERATSLGDLYALGVIAYECVAGRRPFTGSTQVDIAFAHVNDTVPPLPEDVPAPFAAVVMHLLEKDPRRRPESGAALVRELVGAAHTLGLPVSPHPLPAPGPSVDTAPTPAHPVVAPVVHTRRPTLAPELLDPPVLDHAVPLLGGDDEVQGVPGLGISGDTRPQGTVAAPASLAPTTPGGAAGHGRHAGSPADERSASSVPGTSGSATGGAPAPLPAASPGRATGTGPSAGAGPEPAGVLPPVHTRAHSELAERLRERAARRELEEASAVSRADGAPPGGSPRVAAVPRSPARASAPAARTSASPAVRRRSLAERAADAGAPPSSTVGPRWLAVDHHATTGPARPAAHPTPTKYNRSVTAPPLPLWDRVGRWLVIALIVLTLVLIAVATIQNRFGSLSSIVGAGAQVIEEARTWTAPWAIV